MRLSPISPDIFSGKNKNKSRDLIEVFGGYNHNPRIKDNEFYDMKNLSSDQYPLTATRPSRGSIPSKYMSSYYAVNNHGMVFCDWFYYIAFRTENNKTYCVLFGYAPTIHATSAIASWRTTDTESIRQIIPMGSMLIILPDKIIADTINFDILAPQNNAKKIENIFTASSDITIQPCSEDGTVLTADYTGSNTPSDPFDGYVWVDTNTTPAVIKKYFASTGLWQPYDFASSFVKIGCNNIDDGFSEGDGIAISGITVLDGLNTSTIIAKVLTGALVVKGSTDTFNTYTQDYSQQNLVTFARKMPEMDFVIESQNRLWGCRYGTANNEEFVNEIYCSKLGDPTNWEVYEGISTDSYRASVGSEGAWTGAVNYRGYPVFFKENHIHTVLGNYPPYQINDTVARGIQSGSSKSLATINEVLFYKSSHGICAYSGGVPADISEAFGGVAYKDAVGCAYKDKYYVCMKDLSNNPVMFVYDTLRGMWHKEDDLYAEQFAVAKDDVFYIKVIDGIVTSGSLFGTGGKDQNPIEWYAESGIFGLSMIDCKYLSKINMRIALPVGSYMTVSIMYDSSGVWQPIGLITGRSLMPFTLPIKPRRCDHFRLRLEGVGEMKLYSISKTLEQGSDRTWI